MGLMRVKRKYQAFPFLFIYTTCHLSCSTHITISCCHPSKRSSAPRRQLTGYTHMFRNQSPPIGESLNMSSHLFPASTSLNPPSHSALPKSKVLGHLSNAHRLNPKHRHQSASTQNPLTEHSQVPRNVLPQLRS
ncbi:hypothetical protein BJ875DRAFT_52940 [Amylocarpus encephaloides]|uniref:Uncharacterized protein n=1 Tax=Amylocarpus encephaloides TaxID=45428 RepID=A0A9P8C4I6_9HELO|nr:hypothetical protein BJ875DRAFT_52940 [Amylocarpus encephaloides]